MLTDPTIPILGNPFSSFMAPIGTPRSDHLNGAWAESSRSCWKPAQGFAVEALLEETGSNG